jgi:hypothetical protein
MASGSVTPALCGLPAFSLRSVPVLSRSLSRWRQRPCRARTADPGTGAAGVRASRDRNTHWSALGPHGSGNPGTLAGASGHEGYAELAGQRASPRRPAPLEELIGGFESHLSTSPGVWPLELPCERSVDLEVAQHGHATVTSTYAVPGVAGDQAGRSAVHAPGSCQGCSGHRGTGLILRARLGADGCKIRREEIANLTDDYHRTRASFCARAQRDLGITD